MRYKEKEIKKGIKIHEIQTNKFKTNLIAVFLSMPITKENVTKNSLLLAVLRRGSKNMPTQEQMSQEMEEMYGASFDCGLDKTGDNHILKFYLESINDSFIPQPDENMLKTSIDKLLEIIFNPLVENDSFKEEYVKQEKENVKRIIEGKPDNKARYAFDRCIEEMYKDKPYGLYKYGYIEDLEQITAQELYNYYKDMISKCKIDIFVSGDINQSTSIVEQNEDIQKLQEREPNYKVNRVESKEVVQENEVIEEMDVTQGKLTIGLDLHLENEEQKYDTILYNAILGGTANSKMFQEVREKASLAYTASSSYVRYKSNIFIKCGIEIKNYEKAMEIIRKQLEDMKNGVFTDEDIENAKKGIISGIKAIDDEQDTEITYFFGQELTDTKTSLDEYMEKIQNVTKENIIKVANSVTVNTVYFLKDNSSAKEEN
ncbi:MAG: insulinase family protein [Clostridia bacterium]|nr:insulinase family protein [Clostridia bacterium]